MNEIEELFERRDFPALKKLLACVDTQTLLQAWPSFQPLRKAALFKLLEPTDAMEFYRELSPDEKYFLLCAFEPGCIAPLVEDLAPVARSVFRRLPESCFEQMFRQFA